MSELRWGIVGCGDVVEKKSGPSIMAGKHSRIVAIMRRDQPKLAGFANAHNVALCTADPDAIYQHPEVDIVYIATPPYLHHEQVTTAAKAGKHILVEKPMGMNADESQQMLDACNSAGVKLFVAYYRRFQPHVLKIRDLIDGGAIGPLIHGQVEFSMAHRPGHDWGWRTDPAIAGGGLFVDLLSHRIDLMIHFFGEPVKIHGISQTIHPDNKTEDLVTVLVEFSTGAQCTIIGNFAANKDLDRFVLTGTKGEISTDRLDGHAFQFIHEGKTETFAFDRYPSPHTGLIWHIEQALCDKVANGASGDEGRLTDLIIDRGVRQA